MNMDSLPEDVTFPLVVFMLVEGPRMVAWGLRRIEQAAELRPTLREMRAICHAQLFAHLSEPAQVVTDTSYITGWRIPTELLTRRWAHIDFDAGWLRLDPGETNNDDGRQFPLTPDLRAILEAQRHRTSEIERETGTIIPWVFHRNGQPIKSLYKGWRAACKAAGFPTALMHDFRRTAVRNLERAGVPRSAAMKMTGHKTEAVYRRYAIVDEAMLVDSGQKLQALHERHQASPSSMGQVIPLRTKEAKGWRSTKWISSSTC
jgi:integrase